ncbi:GntR family transcriptional regulator [Gimesia chilikensis]|uniref:HTH-type transcriptional regulator McbR n=1 Tax=Gimesia chilikensis TaxID=2605989 RepID=A0A517PK39_9PLAN|nr:GntR family transcriptional regulator [Gimesia chilikensis]QDT19727.1 HTH-type transcriptional regulator McbR [Gimesia chilikensis]
MEDVSKNLTEQSYQYIRQQMEQNVLAPGTRLVNRKLAEELGVSAIPVREAICRLASEGLVEHIQGSGAFVREISREDLDELYVLRDLLESFAAGEAAQFISQSQLEDLQFIIDDLREITADLQERQARHTTPAQFNRWVDLETEFHEILIEASRNRLLKKVIQDQRTITDVFYALRQLKHKIITPASAEETCLGKEQLLDALKKRNPEQARQIMSEQIQAGRRDVLAFMRKQERGKHAT